MHIILDARKLGEKESAHRYLKKVFSFPDYYGNNLDALHDCLSEFPFGANPGIYLLHVNEAGDYFPRVLAVLEDLPGVKVMLSET